MYVGYLGPSGSFTHNAALKAFPEAELVSLGTITEVIKSYEEGRVDYAVIPVENSIEGSVHESLDYLFHQADIRAVAEIVQPIKQQLMAIKHHEKIEKIFSHPQAIAQGKKYIKQHFPHAKIETTASTAFAMAILSVVLVPLKSSSNRKRQLPCLLCSNISFIVCTSWRNRLRPAIRSSSTWIAE